MTIQIPVAVASVADYKGEGIVAECKFRNEYHLVHDLTHGRGIPSFWPRQEYMRVVKRSNGSPQKNRDRKSMFPGYVSFCCGPGMLDLVLDHSDVESTLDVGIQSKFVQEIVVVEAALAANPGLVTYPVETIGHWCRVTAGAFMGHRGKLIKIGKHDRFTIDTPTFSRLVPIEIDPYLLEPCDAP